MNNQEFFNEREEIENYFESDLSVNPNKPFFTLQVNIGEEKTKDLNIYSTDNIEKDIENFCLENNLPSEAKVPIQDLLMEELNKKINQCKHYLI